MHTADGRELLLRRAGGGVIHLDTLSLRQEFDVLVAAGDAGVKVPNRSPTWATSTVGRRS